MCVYACVCVRLCVHRKRCSADSLPHFFIHSNGNSHTYNFQKASGDAQSDSTVTISAKKAKELKLSNGDVVGIVGRRRRATYGLVSIKKTGLSNASISYNMATNLRLRDGDKVKIVPIEEGVENKEDRSGDMVLLTQNPNVVSSVTFSPVEDSYNNLVASEGGDDIEDEELKERFVDNYLNMDEGADAIIMKEGNVISMADENGKVLDFIVSHISESGDAEEEGEESGTLHLV